MNYLFPLNAINIDSTVILLYTMDEVHSFIRKYGQFHDHHKYSHYNSMLREFISGSHTWIVRDDCGRIVKFDDVKPPVYDYYAWRNKRNKHIRHAESLGLPIPGQRHARAGWKQNHPAKKNSGSGKRNRDRSICEYERIEYGIPNKYGKVKPWEGY